MIEDVSVSDIPVKCRSIRLYRYGLGNKITILLLNVYYARNCTLSPESEWECGLYVKILRLFQLCRLYIMTFVTSI